MVSGTIRANGGAGGDAANFNFDGGGGSGGAIHLLAPTLNKTGPLSARGGGGGHPGSVGRIRVEAFDLSFTGTATLLPSFTAPFGLFLPASPPPLVQVTSVAGVPVPPNPTGSFEMPDATIDASAPVTVEIEARSIPLGTIVQLHLLSASGSEQIVDSTPLAGTEALSTASAIVTFPSGFSRGFVRATWAPAP